MHKTLQALSERPVAQALVNADLKFGPVQAFDTWNQNLISLADETTSKLLGELNLVSQVTCPQHNLEFIPSDDPDFQAPAKTPHVSFMYGDQDMETRQKVLTWLQENHSEVTGGVTFKGSHLTLVRTAGGKQSVWDAGVTGVDHWFEVARVALDPTAGAKGGPMNLAQKAAGFRLDGGEADAGKKFKRSNSQSSVQSEDHSAGGALDGY